VTTQPQEGKARIDGRVRLPVRLGNARFEPHTDEPQRPATLVTALALTALAGLANILVGGVVLNLLLIGTLPNSPGLSTPTLLTIGGSYLLLGALTLVGAFGLLVGKPGSRAFVTVVMLLRIATACVSFGVIDAWYSGGSAIGILVSVVVIGLLWDSRANAYFHGAR
jgi:hypothetical protein